MAAQTLREDGFAGRIILISREDRPPYDRPNLSKDYLQGHAEPEWMPLRPDDFFAENDIEFWGDKEVVTVNTAAKEIEFDDGTTLEYDSLLVATGATPRKLPFQSGSQENVFLLRSFADSDAIIAAVEKGKRAVVVGASFIGMEAASSLRTRGCDVTVVAPDETIEVVMNICRILIFGAGPRSLCLLSPYHVQSKLYAIVQVFLVQYMANMPLDGPQA